MIEATSTPPKERDLGACSRIVVKVGSALIAGDGRLSPVAIERLASEVVTLRERGADVVLVVSGAVAAGYAPLGFPAPPGDVVPRQAAASIGQPRLMAAFECALSSRGLATAQLLLTAADIENRRRFLSARHTLLFLLRHGVVPIINENDALSDDEIRVGDNDHLAALVTQLAGADLLVMLSQVDGVLTNGGAGTRLTRIHPGVDVATHLSTQRSYTGTGGMHAKVSAARMAAEAGIPAIIADGRTADMLSRICAGHDVGTFFVPRTARRSARKQWICVRARSRGVLHVDAGAADAIRTRGASLLPAGILQVDGDFAMGSRVDIVDEQRTVIGMGLVNYNAREIHKMRGRRATEYTSVLGYRYVDEIVDRDDLVVLKNTTEEYQ